MTETLKRILSLLSESLEPEANRRNAAEAGLAVEAKLPGFAVTLAYILASPELSIGTRQSAGTALKQFIKRQWTPDGRGFEPPCPSAEDKEAVRRVLPSVLGDSSSKVRTAAAVAIAAITEWDWPDEWPLLLNFLLTAVHDLSNDNLVHGALRCFSMLVGSIDEQQVPQLAPRLLPQLLAIVSGGRHPQELQQKALAVVHGLVGSLAVMSGAFQKPVRALLAPLLQPWTPVLGAILSAPVTVEDYGIWRLKMHALRITMQLITTFGAMMAADIPALLAPCWQMFTASYPVFVTAVVSEEGVALGGANEEVDEQGDTLSLDVLISQLFELLIAMVGNRRYHKLLVPAVPEMLYVAVGYMQMTHDQVEVWSLSVSQYVQDEEEQTFTARVSGELLLDELCQVFSATAMPAALDAVERRMTEAAQAQAAGAKEWWKLREASLLALGGLADKLSGEGGGVTLFAPRVRAVLDSVLAQDLQGSLSNPFLVGRGLWAAAKLQAFLRPDQAARFLTVAAAGLAASMPPPVQVSACRALAVLVPLHRATPLRSPGAAGAAAAAAAASASPVLAPLLTQLYSCLVTMMVEAGDETLHLVLETLHVVVKADGAVAAGMLPLVAEPLLRSWAENVADPLVSEDALDVLRALAASPTCLIPLATHVVPTLANVLTHPGAQPPMLVEASLDLLVTLVRPNYPDVVQMVYLQCFTPLLYILTTADDAGWLQNSSELLGELVCMGGEALLSWGGVEPEQALHAMLKAVERLLDTRMPESDCVFVGNLIYQMLVSLPMRLQPYLRQLLQAVATKLAASNMSTLITGLITVVAKMVHLGARECVDALAAITVPLPGGGTASGLAAALPVWLEHQSDVRLQGRTKRKLSVVALGLLLELRHPALEQLMVRGQRIDAAASTSGVRTRAAAAQAGGEQWSQVPSTVKIAALLADSLAETQVMDGADGDEWPNGEDDDDDDDDEYEEDDGQDDDEEEGGSLDEEVLEETGPSIGGTSAMGGSDAATAGTARSSGRGLGRLGLELCGTAWNPNQHDLLDLALANSPTLDAAGDGGGGDERDEARRHAGDPLVDLNLEKYLMDLIARLGLTQAATLQAAAPLLGPRAKHAVTSAFPQK